MKCNVPVKILSVLLVVFLLCSLFFISLKGHHVNAQDEDNSPLPDQGNQTEIYDTQTPAIQEIPETIYIRGEVVEILESKEIEQQGHKQIYQRLKIKVLSGQIKGEHIEVETGTTPTAQQIEYKVGNHLQIAVSENLDGSPAYYISDFVRNTALTLLFGLFIVIAILIGLRKGFFSLLSMALSFIVLFLWVLPQIQRGSDPVLVSILASIIIVPVTFYFSHGFEKRTTVAIFGTFIALIITGILSMLFVQAAHLTGSASEDALFLQSLGDIQYNLQGLLLAGIIIGTLGVLDDITVSQTSIVYQLHDLKPDLHFSELFLRSIQIGKDHIASMINTLVLVYTGASLPLLLLFMNNPRPFNELISFEPVATEIVRTLVGSIGLILAVPITTFLASWFVKRKV